ncbi:hypothetical protein Hamer_G029239, partial [Homarus americanus]
RTSKDRAADVIDVVAERASILRPDTLKSSSKELRRSGTTCTSRCRVNARLLLRRRASSSEATPTGSPAPTVRSVSVRLGWLVCNRNERITPTNV